MRMIPKSTRTRISRIAMTDRRLLDKRPAAECAKAARRPDGEADGWSLTTLFAWLSPAYPVGAFSYSHGLETAVADRAVSSADGLRDWLADLLAHGAPRSDAIFLTEAHRLQSALDAGDATAGAALTALSELVDALQPSAERRLESGAQGRAFAATTAAAYGGDSTPAPYPLAVGRAAARRQIPLEPTATLYLHAFAANLVGAGVRLVPLGQTEGQRVLAELEPLCRAVAADALSATLDDIGGCALAADIASMRHETQTVRLFRS